MTRQRWIAALAALALLLAAGAGYFAGKQVMFQRESTPKGPVQIEFWHGMADDSAHGKAMKQLVAQFNASQKEVVVTATYQGSYADLEKKVTAAAQAGSPPAVVQVTDSMLSAMVQRKEIQPLSKLIPAADWADYPANFLQPLTFGEQRYAVPFNKSMQVLIYNKRLVPTAPRTWAEFRAAANRATGKQTSGFVLRADAYTFAPFLYQSGGTWLKDGHVMVAREEGVRALAFLQEMVQGRSTLLMKPKEYESDYFNQGRVAMIITTSASYAYIKPANGDPWGVAPLPAGPAGSWTALSGANLAITAGASPQQAEAAAKFLRWMTGKDATIQFAMSKTGYGPVRLSALKDPRWQQFVQANPEYAVLGTELTRALGQPNLPNWPGVQKLVTRSVEEALLQGWNAGDALDGTIIGSLELGFH